MPDANQTVESRPEFGLALSGGGFRASFFHIGVLAALAEQHLLHRFEVISSVSGGSIIAALYYLRLKDLLEKKYDPSVPDVPEESYLTPNDYIGLVSGLENEFRMAVRANIRTRVMANLWKNFKMASARYSRSDRISELYGRHIYAGNPELRGLTIAPRGCSEAFRPDRDNHTRAFKVPILLINSTCLNTGHNWRFEAVRMGEPDPEQVSASRFDKNMWLERPGTWDATPESQRDFRLADAVSASACVPFVFHPLAVSDMYRLYHDEIFESAKARVRAQLVDGGVHDNLGVQGLLDRKCEYIVVSDASGQMEDEPDARTNAISVLSRANAILRDSLREEQLCRLKAERGDRCVLMDLRHGLPRKVIRYRRPGDREDVSVSASLDTLEPEESTVVPPDVQMMLSRIRTDLDSFTDLEAGALMGDGYLIASKVMPEWTGKLEIDSDTTTEDRPDRWWFQNVIPLLKIPDERTVKQLVNSRKSALKVLYIAPVKTSLVALIVLAGLAALFYALFSLTDAGIWLTDGLWKPVYRNAVYWLPGFAGFLLLAWATEVLGRKVYFIRHAGRAAAFILRVIFRVVPSPLIFLSAWIHLLIFDRLFLRVGCLKPDAGRRPR